MKVLIVGAGPAGLATACLLAEAGRCRSIDIIDRSTATQTPGWGITLRNTSLSFLGLDRSLPARRLEGRALWYRGERVIDLPYPPDVHLVTTSRAELLRVLRERCTNAGVTVGFGTEFAGMSESQLATYDLIIAADGASSSVRERHQGPFSVRIRSGLNWYAWLGTTARLRQLSIFLRNETTPLLAWAYQYSDARSALIVECTETTLRERDLPSLAPSECAAMIAKTFERELEGAAVVADAPIRWQRFRGLSCRRLFHRNVVLIGDAAHTTHFSQGFGTAFAFDDALALHSALMGSPDVTRALETFESSQQPKIEAFQTTTRQSMEWAESLAKAAEHHDERRVQTLIAARWPNNEMTVSPLRAKTRAPEPRHTGRQKNSLGEALHGYRVTQMLHVVAKLGVADHLALGPRSAADIAAAVGAQPDGVARLLRALVDVGVFAQDADNLYTLTEGGRQLRSDAPDSLRSMLIMHGEPWWWNAWSGLFDAVRTGRTAFAAVHGIDLFGYLAAHPEASSLFTTSMRQMTAEQAAGIVAGIDFRRSYKLVDVGGGQGALVSSVLNEIDHISAVVFDQPSAIEGARERLWTLVDSGRCSLEEGNFFDAVPSGADTYALKDILHDWDDEKCLAILGNIKRAMGPGARLLVIERVLPPGDAPSPGKQVDIAMLVLTGGRERTEQQYRSLLLTAGFTVRTMVPIDHEYAVLETEPSSIPSGDE